MSYQSPTGNPIPSIILVGRDPETRKKRSYRVRYDPYFYIKQADSRKIDTARFRNLIKDIEPVMLRDTWKRPLVKITTWNCRDIKPVKTYLEKQEVFTYEADLSQSLRFPLRYLIDQGIKSGVEISEEGLKPIDLVCPLRIWLVDVETYSKFQSSVNPWRDEPVILITIWDSYEDKLYTLYQYTDKEFQLLYKKHKLVSFPSEAQMLEYMLILLEAKDPDLLAGWNFMRYDFTKLVERMKKYKIDYKRFSQFNSVDMRSFPFLVKGRIIFDQLLGFKQFTLGELRSYSLAYIAKEELGWKEHESIKGPTSDMWDKEPTKLYQKNVEDVLITKELEETYDLIGFYDGMRREFGGLFHEVLTTWKTVDTALLRLARKLQIALPTSRSRKARESYLGAVILEPKPGIHNDVLCLDFSREYSRIVLAYNIGPETYRGTKGYYKIPTEGDETVLSFARSPKSLLSRLIEHFFKLRDKAQAKMGEYADNKKEYEKWKQRDDIYKGKLNAIYGVMGFSNFRLYMEACARAVPLAGRGAIRRVISKAQELGYEVIYGDTDSVFIKLQEPTLKKQYKEVQYLVTAFNADLELYAKEQKLDENPFILAAKRIYSDFIILSKKRYGGRYVWDEKRGYKVDWEEKGLELVRSDCSELEEEVQTQLLRFILLKTEPDKILQYWSGIEKKLKEKAYSPMEIAYPTQIVRKLGSYIKLKGAKKSGIPAHVSAVLYSNKYLNSDFARGDKPRRLPIDPAKLKKYSRTYTVNGEERELTGVAIDEYFKIPEEIISAIDWGKVYTRLFNKVQKLLALIGIELAKSDAFKKVKRKRVGKDKQSSIQKQKSILEYFGGS